MNPLLRKAWTANYRNDNRDKLRSSSKSHRQKNPASHTQSEAKRRAAKLSRSAGDTKAVAEIYQRSASDQAIACAYCSSPTIKGHRHVDHMTPLIRGGYHTADNLTISCAGCNIRKGSMTAAEFAEGV